MAGQKGALTALPSNLQFKGEIECSCGDSRKVKKLIGGQTLARVIGDIQERHRSCPIQQTLPEADAE